MSSDHQTIRVALVTGSAQGIGRAIAIRFAANGLDVAIDDLPSKLELLQDVVGEIEKMGRKALPLTFDVTREEEVNQMVEKTVSKLGRLDVVCRTICGIGKFSEMSSTDGRECRDWWQSWYHPGRHVRFF